VNITLKILLFLLILGPVPNTNLGVLFDSIQLTSLVIIFYFLFFKKTLVKTVNIEFTLKYIIRLSIYILVIVLPLTVFINTEGYQPEMLNSIIRPIRILINFLGIWGLLTLYKNYYVNNYFNKICKDIVYIIALNAVVMFLQLYSGVFNSFSTSILYSNIDAIHFQVENRVGGFYLSGGSIPSMYQAIPLLIIPYLVKSKELAKSKAIIIYVLLIISIIITGRSGLILLPFSIYIMFTSAKNIQKTVILILVSCFIILFSTIILYFKEIVDASNNEMLIFNYNRFLRLSLISNETGTDQTINIILNKFSIPSDTLGILFGNLNFSNYIIKNVSDMGYNISLYKYGIFGILIYYYPIIYMLKITSKNKIQINNPSFFVKIILITYLLLEFKEEVIYARNGFSIVLIIFLGLQLWEKDKLRDEKKHINYK
jgi:hypothetical protein